MLAVSHTMPCPHVCNWLEWVANSNLIHLKHWYKAHVLIKLRSNFILSTCHYRWLHQIHVPPAILLHSIIYPPLLDRINTFTAPTRQAHTLHSVYTYHRRSSNTTHSYGDSRSPWSASHAWGHTPWSLLVHIHTIKYLLYHTILVWRCSCMVQFGAQPWWVVGFKSKFTFKLSNLDHAVTCD